MIQDLDEEKWDLPSNCFDVIRAKDVFEHLDNPVNFIEEVYRIGKSGALVEITAPHRSCQNWTDPTHKRLAGFETMKLYFTEDGRYSFYSSANFEILENRITFNKRKVFFYNHVLENVVNLNDWTRMVFEQSFLSRLFPAYGVKFVLKIRSGGTN